LQLVTYQNSEDAAYQVRANYIDSVQLSVAGPPENFEPVIRQALADINPDLAVVKFLTLEDQVSISLNGNRLIADLTTLYGILALILACIGLYGVAAYMVARRTAEIGIRMALGANRFNVVRMILRVAMRPIAIGLLIGVPMAFVTGRIFCQPTLRGGGLRSYCDWFGYGSPHYKCDTCRSCACVSCGISRSNSCSKNRITLPHRLASHSIGSN